MLFLYGIVYAFANGMPPHGVGKNVNPVFRSPVFCHWIPMPHLHTAYFFPKTTSQHRNYNHLPPGCIPHYPLKTAQGTRLQQTSLLFTCFCGILRLFGCKRVCFLGKFNQKHHPQRPFATEFRHTFWPKKPCF